MEPVAGDEGWHRWESMSLSKEWELWHSLGTPWEQEGAGCQLLQLAPATPVSGMMKLPSTELPPAGNKQFNLNYS